MHARLSESSTESERETKWVLMLSRWDSFERRHPDKIAKRVQKGIPDRVRGAAWQRILDGRPSGDRPPLDSLIAIAVPPSARVIDADVPRTLHGNVILEAPPARESLRRILHAYANLDPELGYVQGMAFLAAMFLTYMDEARGFWCFATLMRERQHRRLFIHGFAGLAALNRAWDVLVEMKYPRIAQHLRGIHINTFAYTTPWWLTAFMGLEFNSDLRLRLFDRFVMFGYRALFSFGLAVLASAKAVLTSGEMGDCLEILQRPGTYHRFTDWRAAIVQYDKEWIGKTEYRNCLKKADVDFL
jgi:hypothetical protein